MAAELPPVTVMKGPGGEQEEDTDSLNSPKGAVVNRRRSGSGMDRVPSATPSVDSLISTGSQALFNTPEQTIILLDWDDTLCPSTWIRANRTHLSFFKPAPNIERFQAPLRRLEANCLALLRTAMELGSVVIVTNAMEPWVMTSSQHFLPGLLPLVKELPVIYARSVYETQNCEPAGGASESRRAMPGLYNANGTNRLQQHQIGQLRFDELAPQRWKELVFEQEINRFYSQYEQQSWKNIISIGDSIFERDAVRNVVAQRPTTKRLCRTKTLKLFDNPGIEELIEQVRLVHEGLPAMVQHDGPLNIEIDEGDLLTTKAVTEKIMGSSTEIAAAARPEAFPPTAGSSSRAVRL